MWLHLMSASSKELNNANIYFKKFCKKINGISLFSKFLSLLSCICPPSYVFTLTCVDIKGRSYFEVLKDEDNLGSTID